MRLPYRQRRVEDTLHHWNKIAVACLQHADSYLTVTPHTALRFVWGY
ncbi:MAG: hypothetical protein K5920_02280 [Bacteroidales bacterium]|nr:hypothetical protein [Bacteroidales bacterium]